MVVKAQVKTGGRGKAGGVKLAQTPEEAREKAAAILGMDIKGHTVHQVLVTEASDIAEEYYFSFLLDRSNRTFLAMCSAEGGMEIEQLAVERPEALARVPVDPIAGVDRAKAAEIVAQGRIPAAVADQAADVIVKLWETFVAEDATLVEVNPLVRDPQDRVVALDGKVTLDDNAGVPPPRSCGPGGPAHRGPAGGEGEGASDLNYVKLDGEVGIIGNGAGLVMSTLDVVAYAGERHGGVKPANFLDIGGGASAEVMAAGLDVILGDPDVKSVFVNVFGGITACDAVANGIVEALKILGDGGHQAAGGAAGRQQRRGRPADPGRGEPPAGHPGGHDGQRGRQGRRACRGRSLSMSIFLNENSRVIVQGMTGAEGTNHTTKMLAAGTNIVGGVNARKAGTSVTIGGQDLTVFGTVEEAMKETGADVSVLFVPPRFAKDAMIEAIDAGIGLAVVITEGIPVHDSAYCVGARLREGQRHADHRPELSGDHLARAGRTPGSSRRTSPGPGRSGWCRSRGR